MIMLPHRPARGDAPRPAGWKPRRGEAEGRWRENRIRRMNITQPTQRKAAGQSVRSICRGKVHWHVHHPVVDCQTRRTSSGYILPKWVVLNRSPGHPYSCEQGCACAEPGRTGMISCSLATFVMWEARTRPTAPETGVLVRQTNCTFPANSEVVSRQLFPRNFVMNPKRPESHSMWDSGPTTQPTNQNVFW